MLLVLTRYVSRALNIRTISIYTEADAASAHVGLADEAVLLEGADSKAYIDGYASNARLNLLPKH